METGHSFSEILHFGGEVHDCLGYYETPTLVVFWCPKCRDYSRRWNLITGQMTVSIDPTNPNLHRCITVPVSAGAFPLNDN